MDAIVYAVVGFVCGAVLATALTIIIFFNRRAVLAAKIENKEEALQKLEQQVQVLSSDLQVAREKSVKLEAEKESFHQQILLHKEDFKNMETVFSNKFENLSNKIFDDKSEKFKTQSQESLEKILSPLKDKITDFQKKVDDSFGEQAKEQRSLKDQIKNIVEANQNITLQAENLANAIKGDSKIQGDWGEILLENLLEASGLQKDKDYIVQGAGVGLRNIETGKIQKPDIIVKLPDDKHVIIDSKVSLRSYEQFFSETDEALRSVHLKQFLLAVKDRVKELEERRYQDTDKLGTPEIILMFMPIEGAFMLAVQQDHDLHSYAWKRNVAIVCPSTLFATLKTIASLWRLSRQNKNAQEIAKQGAGLYEKIVVFTKFMQDLGKQIRATEETYAKAMRNLSAGPGNILTRADKLKNMGISSSKALPVELLDKEDAFEEFQIESLQEDLDQKTGT